MSNRPKTMFAKKPERLRSQLAFQVYYVLGNLGKRDLQSIQASNEWSKCEDLLSMLDDINVDVGPQVLQNMFRFDPLPDVAECILKRSSPLTLIQALIGQPSPRALSAANASDLLYQQAAVGIWIKDCRDDIELVQQCNVPHLAKVTQDILSLLDQLSLDEHSSKDIQVLCKTWTEHMILQQSIDQEALPASTRRRSKM